MVETMSCPHCGSPVENLPPENWIVPGMVPAWRHADDATSLCPEVGDNGYRPAEPVTHLQERA